LSPIAQYLAAEYLTNRTHWNLDFPFADGSFRLKLMLPKYAVTAGREYTAAQRARVMLPPQQQRRVVASNGSIRRIWIWGKRISEPFVCRFRDNEEMKAAAVMSSCVSSSRAINRS
jgi:hypothetical protein